MRASPRSSIIFPGLTPRTRALSDRMESFDRSNRPRFLCISAALMRFRIIRALIGCGCFCRLLSSRLLYCDRERTGERSGIPLPLALRQGAREERRQVVVRLCEGGVSPDYSITPRAGAPLRQIPIGRATNDEASKKVALRWSVLVSTPLGGPSKMTH
jgi:hypothetical protein